MNDLFESFFISYKFPYDQALTILDLEFNIAFCKKDITFLGLVFQNEFGSLELSSNI